MFRVTDDTLFTVEIDIGEAALLAEGDLRRHTARRRREEIMHGFVLAANDIPAVERRTEIGRMHRVNRCVEQAGAVEFTQYAASKGVKVFYVTNRTKEEEGPTVEHMKALGFPMGDNVDTFLSAKEQPDWGSAKGTRRAVIAKDYRILLLVGDNFGDFSDAYKGTLEERQKAFEAAKDHWGRDWIAIANPTYGSFESAPYKGDYKLPAAEQRKLKIEALTPWNGQ